MVVHYHQPIAPITDTDRGPVNTIVSIALIVVTILISFVRYIISRTRGIQLEPDDAVFWVGVVLAILSSILSQRMVNFGLGQHQDSLSATKPDGFYKIHYATQFVGLLSMYCSKASVVLMFNRIISSQGPSTMKVLLPIISACTGISLLLVAFQCQLPKPWILRPKSCSTHGQVHYAVIALNIVTDAAVAVWIVPVIWALQMVKERRIHVILLLLARMAVPICDVGRVVVISTALRSADSTWEFLNWAVLDQVVVHISLNHATLPRIQTFLHDLQTGLTVSRVAGKPTNITGSQGINSNSKNLMESDQREIKREPNTSSGLQPRKRGRSKFFDALRSTTTKHKVSLNLDAHSSETHLRTQHEHGTEMSTFIIGGDGESTSRTDIVKSDNLTMMEEGWGDCVEKERGAVPPGKIKIEQTVEVRSVPQ